MPYDLDLQRERAAENQSLFREINERIEDLAADAAFQTFVCECADTECAEGISATLEEYEAVRRDPNRFVVLAGHDIPGVEDVVAATERYVVVSKLGVGAAVAEEADPRKHPELRASARRNGRG
jgi:hypothetical protein